MPPEVAPHLRVTVRDVVISQIFRQEAKTAS